MEQPLPMTLESNYFEKFKMIASLPINLPIIQIFKKKNKKRFIKKFSKPGHGNLVLITTTVQVELSKLNKF